MQNRQSTHWQDAVGWGLALWLMLSPWILEFASESIAVRVTVGIAFALLLPVHLNPLVAKSIKKELAGLSRPTRKQAQHGFRHANRGGERLLASRLEGCESYGITELFFT